MVTIFGSDNCFHCLKAKQLCEAMQIKHEYMDIYKDPTANILFSRLFPEAEGIPKFLWQGEKLLGGYQELTRKIDDFIISTNEGENDG